MPRSETKIIDLEAIVRTVEGWGTLDDGTPALALLIENARFYGQGGNAGRSLEELSTELGPLLERKPLTPAAATKDAADPVAPAVVRRCCRAPGGGESGCACRPGLRSRFPPPRLLPQRGPPPPPRPAPPTRWRQR